MKTIFTLFASLILSSSVFAAPFGAGTKPRSSVLTIKSIDQGDIRVVMDGKRFEPGFNSVMIQNIDAGYHSIKIYRQRNTGFFSILGSKYEVVYNSSLFVKPMTQVLITIDRFGRTRVDEKMTQGDGRDRDRNKDWYDDHGFQYDRDGKSGDYDNDRDGRFDGKDGKDGKGYNDYSYSRAISDVEFSRVLDCIQKEWFETNKMKSASQIISTNYFTTGQVKQMLQLFSFESNKLELAKQAYSKTVDKQNYQCVSDMLWFSSSKAELARYIRDCH
jgi:hypothetical protein